MMEKNPLIFELLTASPFVGSFFIDAEVKKGEELSIKYNGNYIITTDKQFDALTPLEKANVLLHEINHQVRAKESNSKDIWSIQTERYPN